MVYRLYTTLTQDNITMVGTVFILILHIYFEHFDEFYHFPVEHCSSDSLKKIFTSKLRDLRNFYEVVLVEAEYAWPDHFTLILRVSHVKAKCIS